MVPDNAPDLTVVADALGAVLQLVEQEVYLLDGVGVLDGATVLLDIGPHAVGQETQEAEEAPRQDQVPVGHELLVDDGEKGVVQVAHRHGAEDVEQEQQQDLRAGVPVDQVPEHEVADEQGREDDERDHQEDQENGSRCTDHVVAHAIDGVAQHH